ncbi:hypothetical protein QYF61_001453 [Mycteria americana]|uniref:Uncharacterized protein n=1 Tax=Mycteria americana TaxID=33587 RepID=A0AAN7PD96_MYCAM|nr:hypothetical protein QYF61_001453 [Mycteria americana]
MASEGGSTQSQLEFRHHAAGRTRSGRTSQLTGAVAWVLEANSGGVRGIDPELLEQGAGGSWAQRVNKQFKNIIQRSSQRLDSDEWQGVWDSMGKHLGQWAPPVFWDFTSEQVQNPEKIVNYLEKVCCHPGNSRETQIIAMCWSLAHAYRALFNTIQNPQGEEKISGSDNKMTGTVATPTPRTGTAAEPENQPVPVSVAPIHKKKYTRKSARLVRDEYEPGPS